MEVLMLNFFTSIYPHIVSIGTLVYRVINAIKWVKKLVNKNDSAPHEGGKLGKARGLIFNSFTGLSGIWAIVKTVCNWIINGMF